MKRVYLMLVASLFVAAATTSCSEKEDVTAGENGEYVDFTVGGGATRTVRSDNNKWQINWVNGDMVRVYCNQCVTSEGTKSPSGVVYADYEVGNINEKNAAEAKLQYTEKGLQWQESKVSNTHRFYAIYPNTATTDMDNGKATFKLVTNQVAQVDKKDEITVESNTSGTSRYAYTCKPAMENAYMVAYAETSTTGVKVPMTFKPIMTTLDVTITNGNAENEDPIALTGLSIIDTQANYVVGTDDDKTFQCSISKNGTSLVTGTTTTSQTYYVDIKGEAGDHYLDLKAGESVTLTVFLPPMEVSSKHSLDLHVHCTGSMPKTVTIGGIVDKNSKTPTFAASSLSNVKLNVKKTGSNNWITPLDDNIYVQQLSIPGTNEAISYLASGDDVKQSKNIQEQLAMGIRAFDVQVRNASGKAFDLYAGSRLSSETMENGKAAGLSNFFTIIKEFLKKNKDEFVIVFCKTSNNWSQFDERIDADLVNQDAGDGKTKDFVVQWKKNLTIAECRGKVILMMRTVSNESRPGQYPAYLTQDFEVTNVSASSVKSRTLRVNKNDAGTLYYFAKNSGGNYTSTPDTRFGYVKEVLEKAKSNATDYPWSLCYIAGSSESSDITKGYADNAEKMHPLFFKWANEQTSYGPFGIVFMDFVGSRTKTVDKEYTTYGDLLPQAIIDNNYRFTMQRATTTTSGGN